MAKKPKEGSADETPALTKYQRFVIERWTRTQITNAPYNPRKIEGFARKKLQAFLKRAGLLHPVTVNRTTGHLVGGHQTTACIDALMGGKDYAWDVAVVEMTEAEEREANIALNNPMMQGDWDLPLLAKILDDKVIKIDVTNAGFEPMELTMAFEGAGAPLPAALLPPAEATSLIDDLGKTQAANAPAPRTEPVVEEEGDGDGDEEDEPEDEEAEAQARKDHVKKQKADMAAAGKEATDTEFYVVVVCRDREEREQLAEHLGLGTEGKYVDAAKVWHAMGVDRG